VLVLVIAVEVGLLVSDGVSTAKTFADPCASGLDKIMSAGLFAPGAGLPGGGHSTAARTLSSGRFTNATFAKGELGKHFVKHKDEWGAVGIDAYQARARSLLSSEIGNGIPRFYQGQWRCCPLQRPH
jgi:hypothetical protein